MKKIIAFHGVPKLKALMLEELESHRQQDQIIKGTYQQTGKGGKFRGCAVGCSIDSLNVRLGKHLAYCGHSAYPDEFGIPLALAYIQDHLFERLPDEESQTWPYRFFEAIPVGADLSHVHAKFFAWTLLDEKVGFWKIWKSAEDQQIFKDYGNFIAYLGTDQPYNKKQWDAVRLPFIKSLESLARLARIARLASLASLASLYSLASLESLARLARIASLDSLDSLDRLDRIDRLVSLDSLDIYKIASLKVLQLFRDAPIVSVQSTAYRSLSKKEGDEV